MIPLPDLDALVTTEEAARHCGVEPVTIRQWVARGHLQRAGRIPGRSAMYRLADVAAAEMRTRERAGRWADLDQVA